MSRTMPQATFTISSETIEQLEWLQDRFGQTSKSAIVRLAVDRLYESEDGPPLEQPTSQPDPVAAASPDGRDGNEPETEAVPA